MLKEARKKIEDVIEIELYEDCLDTYERAYRLVSNNRLLDGIVLTRNAFELMMMLFGVRIDENVRREYCKENSYERYIERRNKDKSEQDYLSQSYLRKIILKKYKNIEEDYNKIYNTFSKFTHPTIHRNILRFFEREKLNVIPLYLGMIMILPILFLEILYEDKTVDSENFNDAISFRCIIEILSLRFWVSNVNMEKIMQANRYAYIDENKKYYEMVKNEIKDKLFKEKIDYEENRDEYDKFINNVMPKVKYSDIVEKLISLKNMEKSSEINKGRDSV